MSGLIPFEALWLSFAFVEVLRQDMLDAGSPPATSAAPADPQRALDPPGVESLSRGPCGDPIGRNRGMFSAYETTL